MTDKSIGFWVVEYLDEDGDLITTNGTATKEEIDSVIKEFARRGVVATAHEIAPPAVNSDDEQPVERALGWDH